MPRMNKEVIRARIVKCLDKLPKPVAKFVAGRVLLPLALMVAALLFAVTFTIFMVIVAVIAPFKPDDASQIFHYIVDGMGE